MDWNNKIDFDAIREGDSIPPIKVKMDRKTYFEYNKLVHEINPLHFIQDYARRLGFKDIVVAGVYTFSFIPRLIAEWIGAPGALRKMEVKFIKPMYIEDEVTYGGVVKKKYVSDEGNFVECEISVENADGEKLIEAFPTVKID